MEQDRKIYTKAKIQISQSRGNVDTFWRQNTEDLTSIRLKNEHHERERRQKEETRRYERFEQIKDEAINSARQNAELEMRWAELRDLEECEELAKAIDNQKSIFKKIVEVKDKLIQEFWDELKKKDEDYVKMLKEQAIEIDDMIEQMRSQYRDMRQNYILELEDVEKQFSDDRKMLLESNANEIKALFDKYNELEKKFVEERETREKKYTKEIEKRRIDDAKDYYDKKIKMETEIQNLDKCLEDMKAVYQLNGEKLDYNLRVLTEKDAENEIFKRELNNKLRHHINRLRKLSKDYTESDAKFRKKNQELTEEFRKVNAKFKELQKKFEHFEKADVDRYSHIHKMNVAEVHELKTKILKCDRTIHVQQLGIAWNVPIDSNENEQASLEVSKANNSSNVAGVQASQYSKGIEDLKEDIAQNVPQQELGILLEMVIDELDFLLDEKTRDQIKHQNEYEKLSAKMAVVKKFLSIDSVEEMNMFLDGLIEFIRINDNEDKFLDSYEEKNDQKDNTYNDLLSKFDNEKVMEYLSSFLAQKDERKKKLEEMYSKKAKKEETEREKKERIAREGKKYWEKLTQVLPDRTFRIWRVLEKALSKYYELLLDRQKLIDETGRLHNQNEELKNLLNQYLQIDHDLIITPNDMIQFNQLNNYQQKN